MIQQGWCPHTPVANPVVWHRRCFNKIADHLVNHTMDSGQDWVHKFEPSEPLPDSANFICHTDGGTRRDSCSSIGWYIEAVVAKPDSTTVLPVVMGGKFISKPVSSFLSEALALDEAVSFMYSHVKKYSARSPKRARVGGFHL